MRRETGAAGVLQLFEKNVFYLKKPQNKLISFGLQIIIFFNYNEQKPPTQPKTSFPTGLKPRERNKMRRICRE